MAAVAIVIPTYNNLPELRRCLQALGQQTFKDFMAYVCVDGSTDGTLAYLSTHAPAFVRVLTHPDGRNHGRNAARNLILPHLHQHRWLATLDSDSVPLPTWMESFLAASPTEKEILLGQMLYFSEDNPNPWQLYLAWREKKRAKGPVGFQHFSTGNTLIPAQAFVAMGGMDPQIRRHGLGDVELGWRLAEAGYTFRYVAEARVWSAVQPTPVQALVRAYEMGRHNLPYLHRKHPGTQGVLFGGKWLTHRGRRLLLWPFIQPAWARLTLRLLPRLSPWGRKRAMRYLLFYAVARGYWGRRLGLPLPERLSPRP
ncbi:MAG: hypothetical protein KatS3mg025_0986 [Bacteroidia bacterium]|nr:MAG: hypothetical protein KatS3mg025_0986 [Bacteroidia bacterium]